ncbi:MAG: IgGFc-binding protein [Prevotellaceae bacterium]|jgi:hypothetical protein|nr:IgGFc-binding protein [Prevotellaceae bacterium]
MKRFIISTLVLVLACLPTQLFSSVTTQGKEFLISFGHLQTGVANVSAIKIVASDTTSVTFTYYGISGSNKTVVIPGGSIYHYTFTTVERTALVANTTASNNTLRLTADKPVSVYVLNARGNTGDATLVLPFDAWGTEYRHLSYMPGNHGDEYVIVAKDAGTNIYRGGSGVIAHTLGANQSIRYSFGGTTDGTGTLITANKPIAYFTSNENPIIAGMNVGDDAMYEQLPPADMWGTNFMVPTPLGSSSTDPLGSFPTVRVVGSVNGTSVTRTYAGGTTQTISLNAGAYFDFPSNTNTGCWITSTQAILVGTYLNMPALTWVPPTDQMMPMIIAAPFNGFLTHSAIILAPTATRNLTQVAVGDKMFYAISGGSWLTCVNTAYSYYVVPLTNLTDAYIFYHPHGIITWIKGVSSNSSYYYVGAAAARPDVTAFYANNVSHLDLPTTIITTNAINFKAALSMPLSLSPGFLKWYIDGVEEMAGRDMSMWNKNMPNGIYEIKMEFTDANNVLDFLNSTLTICVPQRFTVCEHSSHVFDAGTFNNSSNTTYQWYKNGTIQGGATSQTYSCVPNNNDEITCFVTINAGTPNQKSAILYRAFVSIAPSVTPRITISSSGNNICSGTSITYTANITNGGSSPSYQWQINGIPVGGVTTATYAYQPANGDIITCVLSSSATCPVPNPVTSAPITMTVTPTVNPSVNISGVPD